MKKNKKVTFYECIWLFVIGGLLGFVLETIWYFIKNGIWINKQGLIYSPLKPIYGFGLIVMVLFMHNFKDKKIWQKFLLGFIVGSLFEYFGSLFQEVVFGTSTWNYSKFNMNIMGRIYIPYCFAWGVLALIVVDFIYPALKKVLAKLPKKAYHIITIIIAILLVSDITLTALASARYADRAKNSDKNNVVTRFIDKNYPDEFMKKRFPKLKIVKK